ncbi:TPA: AAA family ATPase [Vibrio harveyi]|uniref:ATP-dependent nuclease n=1 Tax=Vibrio harveyi TaxID=669 RepID=UPI0018F22771|nr:AAA family ATPase [Vibrio harveyi]HDM8128884.1 AAA family ATPase [Vibrio harveyi]HDM8147944.1 AAA family ATPase [Vibrio harveyi]
MIAFKQAKFNDYWRISNNRHYDCYISEFIVNQGDILTGATLSLGSGINSIAGKNGVGKSTLIGCLYNMLRNDNSNRDEIDNLMASENFVVKVLIKREGSKSHELVDVSLLEEGEITSYLFDPCAYIPNYIAFIKALDNLNEQLEQLGEKQYNAEQLLNINYLTNTEYEEVKVWNVESEYDDHPILPIFEVKRSGVTYRSATMGQGEAALLYFYWLIDRIASLSEKAILFVEEPESYLPPKTQKRLMNCLAWLAANKGVSVVLSTHSEHILSLLRTDRVQLMIDAGKEKRFYKDMEAIDEVLELGLQKPITKKGLLSVEDKAALLLLETMLGNQAELYSFEIADSEGDLLKRCEVYIDDVDGYQFRAVFDGDSRGKYGSKLAKCKVNRYLPSEFAPDELIHKYFLTLSESEIATILGSSEYKVSIAVASVQGVEFHDYFRELAKSLRMEEEKLFKKICNKWCDNNQTLVREFIESL